MKEYLINFIPPMELGLNFVPDYIVNKGRIEKDPSARAN